MSLGNALLFTDGFEKLFTGLVHPSGGFIVADRLGAVIPWLEGRAGFEVGRGVG